MDLLSLSAAEQSRAVAAGSVSAEELTQACVERISGCDDRVGAFLRFDGQAAIDQAKAIDARRAAGETLGPLAGVPVAAKDVLCDRDAETTCASKMLAGFRPPYDSTVVARLKAAGAVLVGRTNMDEFAMGGSTENSAFQPTRNPWDTSLSPGGSSGGAAACVAAGMAPLSVGTDTGGSIRQPAAFCGVVGVKPTYGRVSRYGLVAFASSLDQAGPLARSTGDAALLLSAIAGHDPCDATSLPPRPGDEPREDFAAEIEKPLEGLRVGVVDEHFGEGLDTEVDASVRAAIDVYKSLGAAVAPISLPHSRFAVACYYVIAPSEASSNLSRYDGVHYGYRTDEAAMRGQLEAERMAVAEGEASDIDTTLVRLYRQSRSEAFGPEVKRRIMLGAYALSAGYYDAYYLKAAKVRRLIRDDFAKAFEKCDLIVGPTAPSAAPPLGKFDDDPLGMYLLDLYTVSANLAGLPAMSLPCGFTEAGLPIGLQVMAPQGEEARMLRGARMYEAATNWSARRPPPAEAPA